MDDFFFKIKHFPSLISHLTHMKEVFKDLLEQYAELKKATIEDENDYKIFNEKLLCLSYLLHGPLKEDFFQEVPFQKNYEELLAMGKNALTQGYGFEIDDNAQLVLTTPDHRKYKSRMIHPKEMAAEITEDSLNTQQRELIELFCANLEEYPMMLFSLRISELQQKDA